MQGVRRQKRPSCGKNAGAPARTPALPFFTPTPQTNLPIFLGLFLQVVTFFISALAYKGFWCGGLPPPQLLHN